MPSERSTIPAKRKAPAFKPPRPSSKAKESSKATSSRSKPAPALAISSDSGEDDEEEEVEPTNHKRTNEIQLTQDPPPTIPPKLLTRLLHHHFGDEKTRIGKDANMVAQKYIETFVREAIARAAFERSETNGGGGRDFLEVEDLEKLAPQLILDF